MPRVCAEKVGRGSGVVAATKFEGCPVEYFENAEWPLKDTSLCNGRQQTYPLRFSLHFFRQNGLAHLCDAVRETVSFWPKKQSWRTGLLYMRDCNVCCFHSSATSPSLQGLALSLPLENSTGRKLRNELHVLPTAVPNYTCYQLRHIKKFVTTKWSQIRPVNVIWQHFCGGCIFIHWFVPYLTTLSAARTAGWLIKNIECGRKLFWCNLRYVYYCSLWWLLDNHVTIIPIYHIFLYNILQARFRCIFCPTHQFTFLLFL